MVVKNIEMHRPLSSDIVLDETKDMNVTFGKKHTSKGFVNRRKQDLKKRK